MIKLLRKLNAYTVYRTILWIVFFASGYIVMQYHVAVAYPLRESVEILVGHQTILHISWMILLFGPLSIVSFEKHIDFFIKNL